MSHRCFFYHKNHQGSITEITDINGNIAKMYKYDAFGKKYFESGPSLVDEFSYTARELHDRTGLYYYRARFYNPQIGRFLSQDPIGLLGGTNLYAYVGNSPVNFIDPLGLEPIGPIFTGPLTKNTPQSITFQERYSIGYEIGRDLIGQAECEPNLTGLRNGPADAWRHIEWSRRMAEHDDLGPFWSVLFSTGHEFENFNTLDELSMDINNNILGLVISDTGVDASYYMNQGDFHTLDRSQWSDP